jgi:VanZ family protein
MKIRIDARFVLATMLYLWAIYWLSSLPALGTTDSDAATQLVSNLAHVPLFAGLTFCVFKSLSGPFDPWWVRHGLALAVSGALAVLDEWHQAFVPGRQSSAGDLLLDLAGIASMLVLLHACARRLERECGADIAGLRPAAGEGK